MSETRIKFSNIVKNQLPTYVENEFPLISEFLKQYYISQEYKSGSIDLIQNIDQYVKLDEQTSLNYEVNLNEDADEFATTINIDLSINYPVVFAFHGRGGTNISWVNKLKSFTDNGEFIGIYPQGYLKSWNLGTEPSKADDVTFVNSIIEELKEYKYLLLLKTHLQSCDRIEFRSSNIENQFKISTSPHYAKHL